MRRVGGGDGRDQRLCEVEKLPQGLRITTHIADVSIEDQVLRFRDEVAEQQATDKIHLLFNNAGIGGGGSLFTNTREQWDKTFGMCWGGVYLGTRTFLPMMLRRTRATSSTPPASTVSGRRSVRACRTPPTAPPNSR